MGDLGLPTVVLDGGSESMRAGYANPEAPPPVVTPTAVRVLGEGEQAGSDLGDPYAGGLARCYERGRVADADALEAVWHHVLYEQLGWVHGEEGLVLLSEPALTGRLARERACQVLFEAFNVSGLFVCDAPTLSLYAAGKTTGLVVDLGAQTATVAPVSDGALQAAQARCVPVGGHDLEEIVARKVAANGCTASRKDCAQLMRQCAKVAASRDAFGVACLEPLPPPERHTLPDGNVLDLREAEAFMVGEVLFDLAPLDRGLEQDLPLGVVGAACESVMGCPAQFRHQMFENVFLCGGLSQLPGLETRFHRELERMAPAQCKPTLLPPPGYMPASLRSHAAWTGGAILAKVVFTQNQHVTRADYNELGPVAVWKRG